MIQIRPDHDLQATARRQAAADTVWQEDYRRWRPPVERAVAGGNRRLRYIGVIKNNAWLHLRAAALNLRTLVDLGLTRNGDAWVLTAASVEAATHRCLSCPRAGARPIGSRPEHHDKIFRSRPGFHDKTTTRLASEAGGTWSRYAPNDHVD
ncbi:transposase [Streptosporangium sandarakinum]